MQNVYKYQLLRTNLYDVLHHSKHAANKQKVATELSWQRLRQPKFSSYTELLKVANFNLPYLHLAPPLGRPCLSFAETFSIKKLESLGYCEAVFAWSYKKLFQ